MKNSDIVRGGRLSYISEGLNLSTKKTEKSAKGFESLAPLL